MSTAVLEKVVKRKQERERASIADYEALVREIGTGTKEPNPDRVEQILNDAGKSVDDLRQAVNLFTRRAGWAAAMALTATHAQEQAEIQGKIDAEAKKLEAAQEAFAQVVNPLKWQLQAMAEQAQAAAAARDSLFNTCPYPALKEKYAETSAALGRLRDEAFKLQQTIGAGKDGEQDVEYAKQHPGEWKEKGERKIAAAQAAAKRLPEVQAQIPPLEKQEAELMAEMLKP